MKSSFVTLQKGKEKPILNHHHWIFSGAIDQMPNVTNGTIMPVYSANRELLGEAYFNKNTNITGRMLSFGTQSGLDGLKENLNKAIDLRAQLFDDKTTAYRIINGEGDGIPGLIVDKYGEILVIQVSTLGIEKLKTQIISILSYKLKPTCIYEKSNIPSRKEEGMEMFEGVIYGKLPERLVILENEIKFQIDVAHSQKTGLYLDQREMRKLVGSMTKGRRLLNCFAYTGGFSLYAARNGAELVDSVDIAEDVVKLAKKNFELNGFNTQKNGFFAADVFKFIRERNLSTYDFVILDPPAFAKKRGDVENAIAGYRDINRIAMKKMPSKSYLLTCSCSYHVDEELFRKIIFQAATDSGKTVRIIQKHHLAGDHPINLYHPEGDYLKSFLLYLD